MRQDRTFGRYRRKVLSHPIVINLSMNIKTRRGTHEEVKGDREKKS